MKKPKPCKYCFAGDIPRDDGNHWIVKSIIPARINIVKCTMLRELSATMSGAGKED